VAEGDPLEEAGAVALALIAGAGDGATVADPVGVATEATVIVGEEVALSVAVGDSQACADAGMGVPADGRAVSARSAEIASPSGRAQPPDRITINNQLTVRQTFPARRALPARIPVCPTSHAFFADRAESIAESTSTVKSVPGFGLGTLGATRICRRVGWLRMSLCA
jgi:hypothetical protein